MGFVRGWVAAALLGLVLCATNVQARAPEADPAVWGVYAHLVGTSWQGKFGSRATRWGAGNQLIEDDSSFGQSVITPGSTPGTLTLKLGSTGLHTFQGTIASDGSVLWVRDGTIKMPYRVALRDNELVEEAVKISGREVVSVKRAMRYQQVGGPRNASPSRPMPTSGPTMPVASENPPMASGVVAAPVMAPPTPMAVPSTPTSVFGPLGALDGQQFAGDTLSLKVQVSDEGRTLTLYNGAIATYVLNATNVPGKFGVAVHPNMLHEYHHEGSFVGQLNADGAIEVRYRTRGVSGSSHATDLYRFDGNTITHESYSESSRGRRMVGSPKTYVPATPELLRAALANAIYVTRAREEAEIENRRAEASRGAMFNSVLQGVAAGLAEVNTGGYAESQANLDATVANIQHAADVERQQQVLAQQQAQARAAEENRQKLAENARWVAEKEQAAAEYRSGQVEAAAAREAQLVAQKQADDQRRANAEAQRRSVEQAATVERQRLQAAALAERIPVAAKPVATVQRPDTEVVTGRPAEKLDGKGSSQLYVFFIVMGNQTLAFEGPLNLTLAESVAMEERLRGEAPGKYGAGVTVERRGRGAGTCLFVYQEPGKSLYKLGSGNGAVDTETSKNGLINNRKATIHRDVVCPNNS